MSATNTTLAESAPFSTLSNAEIAGRLDDVANLLEDQGANQYRVQARRRGKHSWERYKALVTQTPDSDRAVAENPVTPLHAVSTNRTGNREDNSRRSR